MAKKHNCCKMRQTPIEKQIITETDIIVRLIPE